MPNFIDIVNNHINEISFLNQFDIDSLLAENVHLAVPYPNWLKPWRNEFDCRSLVEKKIDLQSKVTKRRY